MKDRKRHVTLSAKELFMEHGFNNTSVQDILDKSGISKGTFYNYFSSKSECLIAILEQGSEETISRRRELLIGQDPANKNILAKQIMIRLEVNQEQNLLPIFQAIFQSNDSDLKAFLKKQNHAELTWFSDRLIDVYGEKVVPFVVDLAVMLHGMMQALMHAWMTGTKEELNSTELVHFAIGKLDAIIYDSIEKREFFLNKDWFDINNPAKEEAKLMKQSIRLQLLEFHTTVRESITPKAVEHLQFIAEELQQTKPRASLLETVITSLHYSFSQTEFEESFDDLSRQLQHYIDKSSESEPS